METNNNGTARYNNADDDGILSDVLRDRLLRTLLASGSKVNADPLLIVEAQETAAERLTRYLDHVTINRAARRILATLNAEEV